MASATEARICFCLCLFFFLHLSTSTSETPTPAPWPEQFHSLLFVDGFGTLRITDLWYDWPNGRNFNIIQYQQDVVKYDVEWNNGTSFIYIPFNRTCQKVHFGVGLLPPNWLEGANYLGQQVADNFLCNVWEKADFVLYYEDVVTRRPVKWFFLDGSEMTAHVMTFEVGAVLEYEHWQAPVYCFTKSEPEPRIHNIMSSSLLDLEAAVGDHGGFRRTLMTEMRYTPKK